MSRDRQARRGLRVLFVLLALLVQFAPSLHGLSPHEHEEASCKHTSIPVHFEAAPGGGDDSPCPVCTQLLHRPIFLEASSLALHVELIRSPKLLPFEGSSDQPALEHPDNRGPPLSIPPSAAL